MAIANPTESTNYCSGTNARFEWQNPDRDKKQVQWDWDGVTTDKTPVQYIAPVTLGSLIETVTIDVSAATSVQLTNALTKNDFYTFVVSGLVTIGGTITADACWEINSGAGTVTASNRLTVDDLDFPNLFKGAAEYDPVAHTYSVGYIGNDIAPTLSFLGGTSGAIQVAVYPNNYQLIIFKDNPSPDPQTIIYDVTRTSPFLNLNLACGGECPSRTSFACECSGDRSCYWDNGDGQITKIFEESANP